MSGGNGSGLEDQAAATACTLRQRLSQIRHTQSDDQAPSDVCHKPREREREMISTQRRLHCLLSGCPHAFPKERRTPGKAQKSHACFMASPGHACLVQSHEKAAAAAGLAGWPWGLASPSFIAGQGPAGRPDSRPDMSTCMKSGSFT